MHQESALLRAGVRRQGQRSHLASITLPAQALESGRVYPIHCKVGKEDKHIASDPQAHPDMKGAAGN